MKIGRKRKGKAEIPTSSMSDIAFLLIIFFMATTKFDVKEGIKIFLPPVATEQQTEVITLKLTEKEMTRFQIRADGSIVINDLAPRVIDNFELDAIIASKLKVNDQMIFRIITEREAKYSEMVRLIDRLKANKAEKISLSTR